jgi:tRNA threonylcarbamoyladenosine biosynthesis protein TsaE
VILEVQTRSAEDTLALGREIGRRLRAGDVIGLGGDLGAGKTCLVRGIAAGLDLDPDVIYSPSFTLVAEHAGKIALIHIDLFRLAEPVSAEDEREIGLPAYLDPVGVAVVEWHRRLGGKKDRWTLEIDIDVGEGDERTVRLMAAGERGREALRAVGESLGRGRRTD